MEIGAEVVIVKSGRGERDVQVSMSCPTSLIT
jgi:hypothetical protein